MQAYVLLKCNPGSENQIISEVKKIPEVVEINGIWGKYDIFVKVAANQPARIERIVGEIRSCKGITSSDTMHVLYGQGGTIDE